MNHLSIRNMTIISILVALASVLHAVEAVIPVPYVAPGAKLGLANVVALYAVIKLGFPQAFIISFLRALLGSLLSGTFLTPGFYLSVSGALVSTLVMYVIYWAAGRKISVVGVSVAGAFSHNITQLTVAALFLRHGGVLFYLPYLMVFAVPTGIFVGFLAMRAIKILAKHTL